MRILACDYCGERLLNRFFAAYMDSTLKVGPGYDAGKDDWGFTRATEVGVNHVFCDDHCFMNWLEPIVNKAYRGTPRKRRKKKKVAQHTLEKEGVRKELDQGV